MPDFQRYKLTITYRGTRYHGWQAQPLLDAWSGPPPEPGEGVPTVQETLARTIASIVNHPVKLIGSSRTDAGVHAKAQVAHFDTEMTQIPPEGLRTAINDQLPPDILIRRMEQVPAGFDAILSTRSKRYQYFIWNANERPVFLCDLTWHRWKPLDLDVMRAAGATLVGEHDFASFARPGHGREHTFRTIHSLTIQGRGPKVVIGVEGSGFLWQMVRIIVGTLVEVGIGRFNAHDVRRMLQAKDRRAAGPTAPPDGLYLQWIKTVREGAGNVWPRPVDAFAPSPAMPGDGGVRDF
jgi:tRNA pseudouridine38-40 synthase